MPRLLVSVALGLLLVVSLGLKATGGLELGTILARQDPSVFLHSIGFLETGKFNGGWTEGRDAGCTIEVMQVSRQGWERSAVSDYAGSRSSTYFYAGKFYAEHPMVRATIDFYIERLKGYLHLPFTADPVWAVVEDENCPAQLPAPAA